MGSSSSLIFIFLLASFLLLISTPQSATATKKTLKISHELSDAFVKKGYSIMSVLAEEQILQQILEISEPKNTLFAPLDKAFHSLSYGNGGCPPLTLLQYHAVPFKISREFLESSPDGLEINTLLHSHPLVKTTIPYASNVSINNVKITDWDIYNDGNVIVHGVESFFDPAFPILYPVTQTEGVTSRKEVPSRLWIEDVIEHSSNKAFLGFGLIIFVALVYFLHYPMRKEDKDDYLPLSTGGCTCHCLSEISS